MSLQLHRDTDIFNFVSPLGKKFPLQRAGRFAFATPTLHLDEERILSNAKDTARDLETASACLSGRVRVKNPIYIQGKKKGSDLF